MNTEKDFSQEVEIMEQASSEITRLRRSNELMSARLQMFDDLMLLFSTRPNYPGEAHSPDIVSAMQKYVASKL